MKAPRHIMVAGSEGRREDHKAGPQWGSGKVEEAVARKAGRVGSPGPREQ